MIQKIKEWFNVMERAKRYAATLNLIDKVLNDFEKQNKGKITKDCQDLIELIDMALET
jgi:hypothetical protein